jgi:hypothetical protein
MHHLPQAPGVVFKKKEEKIFIGKAYQGVLLLTGADISFAELYFGGIAVKYGQRVEAVGPFMTFEFSDAVVSEKRHLFGTIHSLTSQHFIRNGVYR